MARLEFIRLLLAIACNIGFKIFQMDVKVAFCIESWYERFTNFLIEKCYKRGGVEKTLLIKPIDSDIVVT